MKKVTFAILGMGNRGTAYAAKQLKYPEEMEVVAMADTRPIRLEAANKYLNLPAERLFYSAEEILAQPKMADFMIIATADALAALKAYTDGRSRPEYCAGTNDSLVYIDLALPEYAGRYLGVFTSLGSNGCNADRTPCVFILEVGYTASNYRVTILHGSDAYVSYVDGMYRFQYGSGTWTKLWLKELG